MLYLKKLGMLLLYGGVAFLGVFGYCLTIAPFNLPYLLKIPAEADYVFACVFAFTFVSIVVVSVRSQQCRQADLLADDGRNLFLRIVTSRDWIAEQVVVSATALIFHAAIGISGQAKVLALVLGSVFLTLSTSLAFAAVNTVLWTLSYKKANRKIKS